MDSKLIAGFVVVAVVAGGAGYYAGTKSASRAGGIASNRQFGGTTAGQAARGNRFVGGGAAFGSIVAKDANSITVQLMGGANASSTNGSSTGSKIVLYSGSTEVGKTVVGSANDLIIGENVVVNGTPNSDGSITAQMIQIRPAGMGGPGGPRTAQ